MHFNLCLGNHGPVGKQTLSDQVIWLTAGLEDNGHQVTVSETQVLTDAVNIFWEYFPPGLVTQLSENPIPYGIIATEIPDGEGFNNRRDAEWPMRWSGLQTVAQGAKFIWSLVDVAVPAYAALGPAAYLELGFTERMARNRPRTRPRYDFTFAGAANGHRQGIIQALARHVSVGYAGGIVTQDEQIWNLRMGRVGLALKQSSDWRWASPARLGRLVHERIPVAAEYTPVDIGVSHLVRKPDAGEDFVTWALARLDQDLEGEADAIFEAYRATMPMRTCMERALDLTPIR